MKSLIQAINEVAAVMAKKGLVNLFLVAENKDQLNRAHAHYCTATKKAMLQAKFSTKEVK